MRQKISWFALLIFGICQLAPLARADEVDGSDLRREEQERESRFNKLTTEEQLRIRAAHKKAAEDPAVVEAMKKRNQAIQDFRTVLRASMLKADPTIEPLLDKIRGGGTPNR